MPWISCDKENPCAICGRPGWCSYSPDGAAICRRRCEDGAIEISQRDGSSAWLYGTPNGEPASGPARPPAGVGPPKTNYAPHYSALLSALPLRPCHREALQRRGIGPEAAERCGYRSYDRYLDSSRVADLAARCSEAIPGVESAGLRCGDGLLIPCRDADGEIVSVVCRHDVAEPKYIHLSSKKIGGPKCNMSPHWSLLGRTGPVVRITEGPLKADAAAALSGVRTIGLHGCNAIADVCQQLAFRGIRYAWLSLDADWKVNPHVRRGLASLVDAARRAGLHALVECWEEAKGVDDALLAGVPTRLHSPREVGLCD